jgi:hypothetical protein
VYCYVPCLVCERGLKAVESIISIIAKIAEHWTLICFETVAHSLDRIWTLAFRTVLALDGKNFPL